MARRVIDLTLPIHTGMATFPVHWHPMVEVSMMGRHGIEERETRKLVLGTHTGTHMDAPSHFVPGGQTIDNISLDLLVGPAVVLDFTDSDDLQERTAEDLEIALDGRRPERVVLRYDWSQHFGSMKYYSNNPFLAPAAAEWLVEQGVKLVAMDTPMPDDPRNGRGTGNDSPIHKILLGNGVVLVEYLCNLNALHANEIELIVMPLRIAGGDGSPVRCVAVES